ncbi:MAG: type I restriction-modification system subunit M N-terminal domain-containing protein [Kiritimatiellae bacterium]|nr:type I restriction-modification system subunit M N-terminal domain-containing protein [Kiritimatiellia bacterium]
MSERLTQQELESYLWGAAKLLRGLVDAGDYKQYIFPLLFFKRLSDVWDGDCRAALAETQDESYARATADDRFAIPAGAHWSDVRAASRDVGRVLVTAFRAIEAANPERLSGVFGNASWTDKAQMPGTRAEAGYAYEHKRRKRRNRTQAGAARPAQLRINRKPVNPVPIG